MLEHSRIAHYLLSLGVVKPGAVLDGDLVVTEVSRRNAVFLVTSSTGPAFVVKEAGSGGTLDREATVLRALAADESVAGLVPRVVAHEDGRLVLASPPAALDWSRRRDSPASARALGKALGAIHQAQVEVEELPGDDRPWGVTLPEPALERVRTFSSGAIELLARVQADDGFCERLLRLRDGGYEPGFAHRDLRWDNVLLVTAPGGRRRTRVLVIDWELAGPGWPAFDLASALADYVRAAIDAIRVIARESDEAAVAAAARAGLERRGPEMHALWAGYRRSAAASPIEIAELVAVRLLEIAFEYARGASVVSGHILALTQLAQNMLRSPGLYAWNVLGLRG
ncbi:phosphotransferase family protein [Solirubrobacter soli]|uniref:phosphotransferase family protein n=1 Tax=Solirubrobacter soli TaxID=363832 RepID=UPI00047FD7E4|nr:aminoglycoside phosphotransferase family protein [Solirubrobacter soli]